MLFGSISGATPRIPIPNTSSFRISHVHRKQNKMTYQNSHIPKVAITTTTFPILIKEKQSKGIVSIELTLFINTTSTVV